LLRDVGSFIFIVPVLFAFIVAIDLIFLVLFLVIFVVNWNAIRN